MKNNKLLNSVIIFLVIALVLVLTLGFKRYHTLCAQNQEQYNLLLGTDSTNVSAADYLHATDFYTKLKNNKDTKILFLGDELLSSKGIKYSQGLDSQLNSWLKSIYKSNTEIKLLSEESADINKLNEISDNNTTNDFDLAVICCGFHDFSNNLSLEEFAQSYTNLISKLRSKNYNCSIVTILPPNLTLNNDYRGTIKFICSLNNIPYVDLLYDFKNSEYDSYSLISNDLPTDDGYEVFLESMESFILSNTGN